VKYLFAQAVLQISESTACFFMLIYIFYIYFLKILALTKDDSKIILGDNWLAQMDMVYINRQQRGGSWNKISD